MLAGRTAVTSLWDKSVPSPAFFDGSPESLRSLTEVYNENEQPLGRRRESLQCDEALGGMRCGCTQGVREEEGVIHKSLVDECELHVNLRVA
jgi:hypothetical protein